MPAERSRPDSQAFHELLDLLRNAEAEFLGPDRGGSEDVDLAEGYKNLLDLLSTGLDFYLRNDPERPHFDPIVTPTRKFGGDNADALYHFAPLRGDRSYRISGTRGDDIYMGFTVYGGDSEDNSHIVSNLGTEEIHFDAEGRFEIVLSPRETDDRAGNHMGLDPDTQSIIVRQYFPDLPRGVPARFEIEPLDCPGPPPPLTGEEMAERLRRATRWIRGWTALAPMPLPTDPAQYNVMIPPMPAAASTGHWSTPDNMHSFGFYALEDDEALVIEGRSPECAYWSCHLWNAYMNTFDYRHFQVSLNHDQVEYEADGSWRLVVSSRKPASGNWLDTAGHRKGFAYFRWVLAAEVPGPLAARVVKVSELA